MGNYDEEFGFDEVSGIDWLFADVHAPFRVYDEQLNMGVYTVGGQLIFDFNYEEVVCLRYYSQTDRTSSYAFAVRHGDQWKLRTSDDKPFGEDDVYEEVVNFMEYYRYRHVLALIKEGKAKFMDFTTQILYDSIPEEDYYATMLARTTNKFGSISYSGIFVHPFEYDYLEYFGFNDSLLRATKNELRGLVKVTGEVLIPFEYDELLAVFDPDYSKNKLKYPPYFGKKNELFEVLVYNDSLQHYEVRSEPLFVSYRTNYSPKYVPGKFLVTDTKGKSGPLVKDGNIVWRKKLFIEVE